MTQPEIITPENETFAAFTRLQKDLRLASKTMSVDEARFLVSTYYRIQDYRIQLGNQQRALRKDEVPHAMIAFFGHQMATLEGQIKSALEMYASAQPLGRWAMENYGIGGTLTAGLLAHIDVAKAHTAGAVWRFAGLDPTSHWKKGQKRPWNAELKKLCWLIGQSFMKFSGRDDCFYGKIYVEKKAEYWTRNLAGGFAGNAEATMDEKEIGDDTNAILWYNGRVRADWAQKILVDPEISWPQKMPDEALYHDGKTGPRMIPPARVDAMARRFAVKIFLAHYWESGRRLLGLEIPAPFAIAILGHAHLIHPAVPFPAKFHE